MIPQRGILAFASSAALRRDHRTRRWTCYYFRAGGITDIPDLQFSVTYALTTDRRRQQAGR